MTAFNYNNSRATAEKLITKFGQPASFVVPGNDGGYDDFGNAIPAEPDASIDGIVTPVLQYKKQEIDGETIRMGDGYVFFHSDDAAPINANIDVNGKSWRVVDITDMTSVDGINVYRKLQLRSNG